MFEKSNSQEQIAREYIASVMSPEQVELVMNILNPEQALLVKDVVERGERERVRWEEARKKGRLGEEVAEFNSRTKAIELASGVLNPSQQDFVRGVLDKVDEGRHEWEKAREEGRLDEMIKRYNEESSSRTGLRNEDERRSFFNSLWRYLS